MDEKRDSIETGKIGEDDFSLLGEMPSFEERERAAGLHLAGNDPLSGRRDPSAPRDSEDGIETVRVSPRNSGFSMRQLTGGISSDDDEPTTSEYQTALQSTYTDAAKTPRFGDLISLRVSGGSRLVARFWILKDDQAATTATIAFTFDVDGETKMFYALNVTYTPLEQIIDAVQDYMSGPNGGQEPDGRDIEPEAGGSFAISVNGIYDTDEDGFLVAPSGNPTITVNGGRITVAPGVSADIADLPDNSGFGFPSGDGVVWVRVYAEVDVTFKGTQGSRAMDSASGLIVLSTGVFEEGWRWNSGTDAKLVIRIGAVGLARRGNRRFAKIVQLREGDQNGVATGSGAGGSSGTDANGASLADGPREVTLCINGKPYSAFILAFNLTEIT